MAQKRKILLLGAAGMAGHVLLNKLLASGEYEVIDVARDKGNTPQSVVLDITSKEKVEQLVNSVNPDYIVNCIGVLIKGSQQSEENAIYINSYLPHQLAKLARQINARLIHISTDCVFSGKKGDYLENDEKDGADTYARSKALGEVINDRDLTIRTSIIGPELKGNGEGLFHWFMNQQGNINGFTTAYWSGVTTLELANAIIYALNNPVTGLVHLTTTPKISKYDLLGVFKKVYDKKDVNILPIEWKHVDKSLVNTRTDFPYQVPSYEEMLSAQLAFMQENINSYPHYAI